MSFEAPPNPDRYRQCEACRDTVDRTKVAGGVCPSCGKPVLRQYGPPFDELRERTGATLAQCKHALDLADGDVDAAVEVLADALEQVA